MRRIALAAVLLAACSFTNEPLLRAESHAVDAGDDGGRSVVDAGEQLERDAGDVAELEPDAHLGDAAAAPVDAATPPVDAGDAAAAPVDAATPPVDAGAGAAALEHCNAVCRDAGTAGGTPCTASELPGKWLCCCSGSP